MGAFITGQSNGGGKLPILVAETDNVYFPYTTISTIYADFGIIDLDPSTLYYAICEWALDYNGGRKKFVDICVFCTDASGTVKYNTSNYSRASGQYDNVYNDVGVYVSTYQPAYPVIRPSGDMYVNYSTGQQNPVTTVNAVLSSKAYLFKAIVQ